MKDESATMKTQTAPKTKATNGKPAKQPKEPKPEAEVPPEVGIRAGPDLRSPSHTKSCPKFRVHSIFLIG